MEALRPPERLERLVLALIPPCARETVAGDLCETYENPRQYLREALCTVPHLIASQARRNLNLPALMLQLALAWWLVGDAAAAVLTPLLLLREAYRPLARPSALAAIRETMAVALLTMVFVQALSFDNGMMRQLGLSRTAWTGLYFFGFLVAPLMCVLRTGLIVGADKARGVPHAHTLAGLRDAYRGYCHRARQRNAAEALALLAAAMGLQVIVAIPELTALFAVTGSFLLIQAAAARYPAGGGFAGLRALYRHELDRQQQLRRFLWWLWFTPLLVHLHQVDRHILAAGRPIPAMISAASVLLLCFLIASLNREQDGRTQEDIGALERLREAAA
jgi:hypothetical protein